MAEKDNYRLNASSGIHYSKITEYAVCVNNQDPKRAGRIRAVKPFGENVTGTKITNPMQFIKDRDIDAAKNNEYVPWGKDDKYVHGPFLPLHINVSPQPLEGIKLIKSEIGKGTIQEEYIGPYISEEGYIQNDSYEHGFQNTQQGMQDKGSLPYAPVGKNTEPKINPQGQAYEVAGKGSFANPDDVRVVGRNNTDIILGMKAKVYPPIIAPPTLDEYPQILIRAGKLTYNKGVKSRPTANPYQTMIQLNHHENEMYLHSESKKETFTPDAPLATLVEYYIDQANLGAGIISGTITLYKMPLQDSQGTIFMASEFGPETVIKNVDFTGAPKPLNQVAQMSFNLIPNMTELGNLINDFIDQIDRGKWSEFIKPIDIPGATVSKSYNPNVDLNIRNGVGAYLQRAHPLYYRPKESTRILMDGAEPAPGGGATWPTSQGSLSELKELIKLSGVETEGYGLAYTDDTAVREPKPEEKNITQKVLKVNGGIQQGFITAASERIYLLSHNRAELGKITLNTNYGISQKKFIEEIDEKTNSLVRGEELLKLLEKIVEFTSNHTHAFPGLAPVPTAHGGSTVGELNGMLLEAPFKILNQNIRIN